MMILFIDFETFYSREYSLKKMPTMQYIRDSRFQVLGASVAIGQNKPSWMEPEPLRALLHKVPWDRVTVAAHNAAFDGAILEEHYGFTPMQYECTMLQARLLISQGALDPEQTTSLGALAPLVGFAKGDLDAALAQGDLAAYANLDLTICQALHEKFRPDVHPLADEIGYMDTHIKCATRAVFNLDVRSLRILADQDKAMEGLFPLVRKDETFASMLAKFGVQPSYKTTAKGSYKLSTAKTDGWLESLLTHDDERVRMLAAIRQKASSTIERTRAQRFLDVGAPLPAPLLYYAAHTGRAGGQDNLNVQNLPRKDGLRQCILSPEGHSFVIVDSAQIEVRVLAWLAQEEVLLQQFRDGVDPYKAFAGMYLYNCTPEDVTKDQRQVGKAAVLALGFGQGANGFLNYCATFGIPMTADLAATVVSAYRRAFKRIRAFWKETEDGVRSTGVTMLPSGRQLTYPALRDGVDGLEFQRAAIFRKVKSEGFSNLWHGKLVENYVQAAARDVVFAQTARLKRQGWAIALMVHDETVLVVPDARIEDAREACRVAFGAAPKWAPGLPVGGEVVVSKTYVK